MNFGRILSNLDIYKSEMKLSEYAFYVWYLEENADLTYKEARVLLRDIRGESIKDLCLIMDCSPQNIYNIERRALRKINDALYVQ